MSRRDFAFHRALFWKEWHKFRGLLAAVLAYLLYIYPISLLLDLNRAASTQADRIYPFIHNVMRRLRLAGTDGWTLLGLFAIIIISGQLIGKERQGSAGEFVLVMPFSRGQIFFNKYLFAVASIGGIYLVNALLLGAITAANRAVLSGYIEPSLIARWLCIHLILLVLLVSFSLIFSVIAGNGTASIILAAIFAVFPQGISTLIRQNMVFFGWPWTIGMKRISMRIGDLGYDLSLLTYMTDSDLLLARWPFLLAFSIVLFLIGQRVFAMNPMERNGEMLMFRQLEGVLQVGVTVCFMLLAGSLFRPYTDGLTLELLIRYLAGGALGWWMSGLAIAKNRTRM